MARPLIVKNDLKCQNLSLNKRFSDVCFLLRVARKSLFPWGTQFFSREDGLRYHDDCLCNRRRSASRSDGVRLHHRETVAMETGYRNLWKYPWIFLYSLTPLLVFQYIRFSGSLALTECWNSGKKIDKQSFFSSFKQTVCMYVTKNAVSVCKSQSITIMFEVTILYICNRHETFV